MKNRVSHQYLNSCVHPVPSINCEAWSSTSKFLELAHEKLLEGPRILIVAQCPDEMFLFILLAAWGWHWQYQSCPASVLTWLHLFKPFTCCNSEVGNQKLCYLCTSLTCPILQKFPPWHHLLRNRIYLWIWNTHWTGIKSSQRLSPYEASNEAQWPCFQMINFPWLLSLVTIDSLWKVMWCQYQKFSA